MAPSRTCVDSTHYISSHLSKETQVQSILKHSRRTFASGHQGTHFSECPGPPSTHLLQFQLSCQGPHCTKNLKTSWSMLASAPTVPPEYPCMEHPGTTPPVPASASGIPTVYPLCRASWDHMVCAHISFSCPTRVLSVMRAPKPPGPCLLHLQASTKVASVQSAPGPQDVPITVPDSQPKPLSTHHLCRGHPPSVREVAIPLSS